MKTELPYTRKEAHELAIMYYTHLRTVMPLVWANYYAVPFFKKMRDNVRESYE